MAERTILVEGPSSGEDAIYTLRIVGGEEEDFALEVRHDGWEPGDDVPEKATELAEKAADWLADHFDTDNVEGS